MRRLPLFALLLILVLVGVPLAAQRVGGFHGGGSGVPMRSGLGSVSPAPGTLGFGSSVVSPAPGFIGPSFIGPGFVGSGFIGRFPHRPFARNFGFSRFRDGGFPLNGAFPFIGGAFYPLWQDWYDEPYWYDQAYAGNAVNAPAITMQRDTQRLGVIENAPPANPKLIELPETGKSAGTTKPQLAAVFVLSNGERLEAQRYMLTEDNLYVTVGRKERKIPLSTLDLNATIAANRERGVDLKVPDDRSEISLGF